jgi:hypothetical protein
MNIKIHTNENQDTIYKQAERFAEITKSAIVSGNIVRAKKMFGTAERLFALRLRNQKRHFKYVFSVSTLWNCAIATFPIFSSILKSEYLKQINTSGV